MAILKWRDEQLVAAIKAMVEAEGWLATTRKQHEDLKQKRAAANERYTEICVEEDLQQPVPMVVATLVGPRPVRSTAQSRSLRVSPPPWRQATAKRA